MPNDPSSATRPAGRHDCNRSAMAGFAAAHGLARLTFTQRTTDVHLATKTKPLSRCNPVSARIETVGQLLVKRRKHAGLTQKITAAKVGIPRKWLGRWERGRALPNQAQWSNLAKVLELSVVMPKC
jgi:ribosome-binding protein aMBF1 (putative translation factor)